MSVIDDLAAEFAKLPGIGRKTALRLTYHLLKQSPEQSRQLAGALQALVARVRRCSVCNNLTEQDPCALCVDPRRDHTVVCVVEDASDVGAIERAGEFRGLYHVLGGRLSPLDGVGPEDLAVQSLVDRVSRGDGAPGGAAVVREVILATNPSMEGEATALYVQRQLAGHVPTVSRIARGIPVGGDLEYADGVTIAQAISARREM
ncbi:MAG TPA: recombination mediator RecR [Gemmatimonadaceae bacterium]|nr:recombination mediator RecR [Gemmatimonadaceae bacterium]